MTSEIDDLTYLSASGFGTAPYLALKKWSEVITAVEPPKKQGKLQRLPTPEVRTAWNNLQYKIQVLQGLSKRVNAKPVTECLTETLERLKKIESRYQLEYRALPELSEPNRETLEAIVHMLLRLSEAIFQELVSDTKMALGITSMEEDLGLVLERIRGFWRREPTLLGGLRVPPQRQKDEPIINFYRQYYKRG